jgi:hypothetical protein
LKRYGAGEEKVEVEVEVQVEVEKSEESRRGAVMRWIGRRERRSI